MKPLVILTLSFVLLRQAGAQEGPLVGELAPPFVAETCVNRPLFIDSSELVGEVILLEFWGTT